MGNKVNIDREVSKANAKIEKTRKGLANKLSQYISGKRAEVSQTDKAMAELEEHRENAQSEISRAELALQGVERNPKSE